MSKAFPGGVWPVMLTPYTADDRIDYDTLTQLTEWYISQGVSGLFAVCQSSELFFLSLEERASLARAVKRAAAGRVPVIASGHTASTIEAQISEMQAMEASGVDALILISNRLASEQESDDVWISRCEQLLAALNPHTPLGLYECPWPYKRLLSPQVINYCVNSGRFHFLKDTCCDSETLRQRLALTQGSALKIYNANTTTLLSSLRAGAAGYSGVMANFHPRLYAWLCRHPNDPRADALAEELSLMALIERQYYPVNAKYYLGEVRHLPIRLTSRQQNDSGLTTTYRQEVQYLAHITDKLERHFSEEQ